MHETPLNQRKRPHAAGITQDPLQVTRVCILHLQFGPAQRPVCGAVRQRHHGEHIKEWPNPSPNHVTIKMA